MPGLMTAEQLLELPEDNWRHEFVDGELTTMPYRDFRGGTIAGTISGFVGRHVDENGLGCCVAGGTGFILGRNPDTVRAPAFAFTSAARHPGRLVPGYTDVPPDLAVEILLPPGWEGDLAPKVKSWLDAGVRLVWVIDPDSETVAVHRPSAVVRLLHGADAVLSGEDVLPGFSLSLGEIFG